MTSPLHQVGHTADTYLLFNFAIAGLNATDHKMAHIVYDYWEQFVNTGSPNVPAAAAAAAAAARLPRWPQYNTDGRAGDPGDANATLILNLRPEPLSNLGADRCKFWDSTHRVPY